MTKQERELQAIKESKSTIYIKYETPYSKGEIRIKKALYLKVIKKLNKALKDAIITNFEEILQND